MAEANPSCSSDDNEELNCAICFEPFDAVNRLPKFLACHHTFCVQCLQVIVVQFMEKSIEFLWDFIFLFQRL